MVDISVLEEKVTQKGRKSRSAKKGLSTIFNKTSLPVVEIEKPTSSLPKIKSEKQPATTIEAVKPTSNGSVNNQIITSSDTNPSELSFDGENIKHLTLASFLMFASKLTSPENRLLSCILSKTNFSTTRDVFITEQDMIDFNIRRGSEIRIAREGLIDKKIISCRLGKRSKSSKRPSYFYSMNDFHYEV